MVAHRYTNTLTSHFLDTAWRGIMPNNVLNDLTSSTALVSLQSRPDIRDLIDFARKYSPYYYAFYSNVARDVSFLQDYPIVDLDSFWRANTCKKSQVITMPHSGGIVWKTGGKKSGSKRTALLISQLSMCRNPRKS